MLSLFRKPVNWLALDNSTLFIGDGSKAVLLVSRREAYPECVDCQILAPAFHTVIVNCNDEWSMSVHRENKGLLIPILYANTDPLLITAGEANEPCIFAPFIPTSAWFRDNVELLAQSNPNIAGDLYILLS